MAAKALENLGVSLEAVRQQAEEIIGRGQRAPNGHIPFTPRATKVLELESSEARQLGHPGPAPGISCSASPARVRVLPRRCSSSSARAPTASVSR